MSNPLPFEAEAQDPGRGEGEPRLLIDVDGYEGPLDLLLDLARRHKIDLQKISIRALAEQYLDFVEEAHRMRLELAADYLVMAAWLAFLKSRLLLPEPAKDDEPQAGDLASALAFRLRRLEAIREAALKLGERDRLGVDVFARGAPEPGIEIRDEPRFSASLYDLLAAYARQRQKQAGAQVTLHKRQVWTLAQARELLEKLVGEAGEWTEITDFLARYLVEPAMRPTVIASSLSAALELVREGHLSLSQDEPFAPLMVRRREPAAAPEPAAREA